MVEVAITNASLFFGIDEGTPGEFGIAVSGGVGAAVELGGGTAGLLQGPSGLVGTSATLAGQSAYEFNNTHLTITGDGTAGTMLSIGLTGKVGLRSFLFLGTTAGEISFPPFGALCIDLSSSWMFFPLGTIPSTLAGTIPAGTPPGIELIFQGLGVEAANGSGNLSNAGTVTTR